MKKRFIQTISFGIILLGMISCSGTSKNEGEDSLIVDQQKLAEDSLTAIQNELTVTDTDVTETDELLAQNLEEKSTQKNDDDQYIKTELNDVVISRKINNPVGIEDGGNGMGPGNGGRNGSGDFNVFIGSGDESGSGDGGGNRHTVYTPQIKNPTATEGTVYLKLTVNAEGLVAFVKHIPEKSTTSNEQLINEAQRYATQYRYQPDNSRGPTATTTEYITIAFKL